MLLQLSSCFVGIAHAAGDFLVPEEAFGCVACKTIDWDVFSDPQVRQTLAGVVLLRADVTEGDANQRALMREHQVLGPPTVMLFDPRGLERRHAMQSLTAEERS